MNSETLEVLLRETTWMKRLAARLIDTSSDADDLVSETYLAAVKKPFEDRDRAKGWMARVLRNRAARRLDRRRRGSIVERAAARPDAIDGHEGTLERLEIHELLVRAVRGLDEPFRSTIVARYFEGLDTPDIARRMNVDVGTVRSRLSRATTRLRERLTSDFGGDTEAWRSMLLPFVTGAAKGACATTVASGATIKNVAAASVAILLFVTTAYLIVDRDDSIEGNLATIGSGGPDISPLQTPRRDVTKGDASPAALTDDRDAAATTSIRALLRDARRSPVVAARLEWMDQRRLVASQTTDAEGKVALQASTRPTRVLVIASNHASTVFDVPADSESIDLTLPGECAIAGRITVDGRPPGYEFDIEFHGDVTKSFFLPSEVERSIWSRDIEIDPIGRVLADGTFRVEGLSSSASGRIFLPQQFTIATVPLKEPIIHFDAPREDILIDVGVVQSIVGRVVDAAGQPVEKCLAIAEFLGKEDRRAFGSMCRMWCTKLDGRFRLDLRTQATRSVDLQFRWRGRNVIRKITDLGPGVTDLGDIAIPRGRDVTLNVHRADGSAIAGAVAAFSEGARTKPPAAADLDGRIVLDDVAGVSIELEVAARGFRTQFVTWTEKSPDVVDVVLEPTNELSVKVVDDEGRPIERANVRMRALVKDARSAIDADPESRTVRGNDLLWTFYVRQRSTPSEVPFAQRFLTDADGKVELPSVRTDQAIEAVVVDLWNRPISESRTVRLGETEARSIELVADRRSFRSWRGRVTDAEGRPNGGAKISFRPVDRPSEDSLTALTGDEGFFTLNSVGSARLLITVGGTSVFLPHSVEKDAPGPNEIVEIIVDRRPVAPKPSIDKTLVIRAASGQNYGGVVSVRRSGEESFVVGNAEGEFAISGIPPEGAAVRYVWGEQEFERIVSPDEERPTIVLPRLTTIRFTAGISIDENATYRVSLLFSRSADIHVGGLPLERNFSGKSILLGEAEWPNVYPGRATINLERMVPTSPDRPRVEWQPIWRKVDVGIEGEPTSRIEFR